MNPPISKDWWLAAALTGATLPAALGQPAPTTPAGRQTGVVTKVTKGTAGTSAPLYVEAARGQKVTTGPNEVVHVLFSDQSALTVGPSSEVTIAEYRYDTQAKDGNLLVEMTKGVLRVVGGFISKRNATQVRTSTATIGIRGGISIVQSDEKQTQSVFLFGQEMRVSDGRGNAEIITRPGFGLSVLEGMIQLSSPERMDFLVFAAGQFGFLPPSPRTITPPVIIPGSNPLLATVGPDRVGQPNNLPGQGIVPPTLSDVLGSQAPGNRS